MARSLRWSAWRLHDDASWSALAVGDCCVFHVRGDALLTAFPVNDAACSTTARCCLARGQSPTLSLRSSGAIRGFTARGSRATPFC